MRFVNFIISQTHPEILTALNYYLNICFISIFVGTAIGFSSFKYFQFRVVPIYPERKKANVITHSQTHHKHTHTHTHTHTNVLFSMVPKKGRHSLIKLLGVQINNKIIENAQ